MKAARDRKSPVRAVPSSTERYRRANVHIDAAASGAGEAPTPIRPIQSAVGALDGELNRLESIISEAHARLEPVLEEQPPPAAVGRGNEAPAFGASPIARTLGERCDRLSRLSSALAALLARAEC